MSPHDPLGYEVFVRTAWWLLAAFAVLAAGAAVRERRRREHPQERSLVVPLATAVVLTYAFLLALFAGGFVLLLAAAALALQGLVEYARLTGLGPAHLTVLAAGTGGALVAAALGSGEVALLVPLALFAVPVLSGRVEDAHRRVGAALFGYLFIGVPMVCLVLLRDSARGPELVLVVGVCSWLSDACGYIVGSKAGGPRLAPRISPGKTWAGAAGSVAGAVAGILVLRLLVPLPWGPGPSALLAVLFAVCAIWGDLVESVVKRNAAVKDAGRALPGFGGVLDRFDSLLVSLPVAYYLASEVRLFQP